MAPPEKTAAAETDGSYSPTEKGNGASATVTEATDVVNASGHRDQLQRQYGLLAICGFAISIDSAWVAFSGSISVAILNGGPPGVLYELLTACFYYLLINASIAELASAVPSSAGVIHWTYMTSRSKFLTWMAGWLNFAGWIFDLASIAYIPANVSVQMYLIYHPDLDLQPWMTYVAYCIVVVTATAFTIFGNRFLPMLQHVALFLVLGGGLVTIICLAALPASHNGYASSSFVWTDFENQTGWPGGVAFLTGVLNGAFAIGTADGPSHLAEELPNPRRDLPKAIMAQVITGGIMSFAFGVALFYGVIDLNAAISTPGSFVLGPMYQQATGTAGGALGLLIIVLLAILLCTIGTIVTCSRIWWTLARDDMVPLSGLFAQVNEGLSCPIPATLLVNLCAILSHLLTGRRNVPVGDFHLGAAGFLINAAASLLIIMFNVFFCLPYSYPVTDASTMNYNSVILVGVAAVALFWWLVAGMRHYKGPKMPHLDAAGHDVSAKGTI